MTSETIEAIKNYLRLIRKSFECTICLDFYENPYKTNCGHIFCKKCISDYFRGKSVLKCPLCNTEIQIRSLKKFTSMSEYVSSAKSLERVAMSEINQVLSETEAPRVVEKKKLTDKTNENLNDQPKPMKRKPSNSTAIDLNRNKKQKKVMTENKENVDDQQHTSKSISNNTPKNKPSVRVNKENEQTSQGIEFVAPQIPPSLVEDTFHDTVAEQNNAAEVSRQRFPATSHLRKEFQLKTIPPLKFKKDETGNHFKSKTEPPGAITTLSKDSLTTPRNLKHFQQTSRSAPAKPLAAAVYQRVNDEEPACEMQLVVDNTIIFDRVENNTGTRDQVKFRLSGKLNKYQLNKSVKSKLVEKTTREESTNTETSESKMSSSIAVQTDHVEAFFHSYNIDLILDKIVGFVYTQVEYSETNEFIQDWIRRESIEPPPPDVTVIPDSPENVDHSETGLMGLKSFAFGKEMSQVSKRKQLDFVTNTSGKQQTLQIDSTIPAIIEEIVTDTPNKDNSLSRWSQVEDTPSQLDITLTKMIARAECVNAAKIVLENSMRLDLSTSFLMNKSVDKSVNESLHEVDSKTKKPEAPPGPLIITDTMTIDDKPADNLIITDTMPVIIDQPVKTDKPSVIQELIISDTVNPTSQTSQMDKSFKSTINPSLAPTLILNESISNMPSPPKPVKRGLARISNARRNQSALLDSIDEILDDNASTTDHNATGALELTAIISSKNDNSLMRPPPAASAILGDSMLMNQSTNSINRTLSIPPVPLFHDQPSTIITTRREENKSEMVVSRDTFTDSNLMLIDNICQEMYADQNCSIVDVKSLTGGVGDETTRSNQYEFACSLLDSNMKTMLIKFAQSMNIPFVNEITPATTHLIVKSYPDNLCDVTSKYLRAISRKIWIVSMKWIVNCINQGQIVKPDEFEIKGDRSLGSHDAPMKARLSRKRLFENYEFMFVGDYGLHMISKSEIIQLAAMNGASIKTCARDFSDNTTRVILFDDSTRRFSRKDALTLLSNQVHCVNKSWMLDSLASFTILAMEPYQTYDD